MEKLKNDKALENKLKEMAGEKEIVKVIRPSIFGHIFSCHFLSFDRFFINYTKPAKFVKVFRT
jgi:hypothetical protein